MRRAGSCEAGLLGLLALVGIPAKETPRYGCRHSGAIVASVSEAAAVGGLIAAAKDGPPSAVEVASGQHSSAVASSAAVDAQQCRPVAHADKPEDSCAGPVALETCVAPREDEPQHAAAEREPAGCSPWCSGATEPRCSHGVRVALAAGARCWRAAEHFRRRASADCSVADAVRFSASGSARARCYFAVGAAHCCSVRAPAGCSAADAAPRVPPSSRWALPQSGSSALPRYC